MGDERGDNGGINYIISQIYISDLSNIGISY